MVWVRLAVSQVRACIMQVVVREALRKVQEAVVATEAVVTEALLLVIMAVTMVVMVQPTEVAEAEAPVQVMLLLLAVVAVRV